MATIIMERLIMAETYMIDCLAENCKNNKNRKCKRYAISVNKDGKCNFFVKESGGHSPKTSYGDLPPFSDSIKDMLRDSMRMRYK